MLKILLPSDGSENALRATVFLARKSSLFRDLLEIHLLNVQPPFPGTIRGVRRQAQQEHHDEGIKALAAACKLFDDASIKHCSHIGVGDAPAVIAHYVADRHIEQVVMGARGLRTIADMLLWSVTTKVLHLVRVPVLLVP